MYHEAQIKHQIALEEKGCNRMNNNIKVVNLQRIEDGAHSFAQIYMELQKQAALVQFTLDDVMHNAQGEWAEEMRDDVRVLLSYIDIASELAAGLCADLDDDLELFLGAADEYPDGYNDEYPEEFE